MSKQNEKSNIKLSDWEKEMGIELESMEKMVEAGNIYPTLKPKKDTIYRVKILNYPPKKVKTKMKGIGTGWVINVEHIQANAESMKKSLFTPKSFIQSLSAARRILGLDEEDLVGRIISFQKSDQILDTKNFSGNAEVYSVQILE